MKIKLPRGYRIDTKRKEITVWPCPAACGYVALSPAGADRHYQRKHAKRK